MPAYRIVVPPPWEQVSLGEGSDARLDELVEDGLRRLPPGVSPDEVGPLRRNLRHRLATAVAEAGNNGASDIFVPTDSWHGFHLGASIVVAQVAPPIDPPAEITADSYVPLLMAQLLQAPGATVVSTADCEWVRTIRTRPAHDEGIVDTPTVSVDYLTPTPDALGTWTSVTYSTVGDGDPDSETTALSIELFDAIMSTWAWGAADDITE